MAQPKPQPITPQVEAAVLDANRRFYESFAALDLAQMESVWAHEDWAQCVHPGWELLLGWEEIRQSWLRIFSHAQRMQVTLGSVWVRIEGTTAWVSCTERVTSSYQEGFSEALVQATNIFVLRDGRWLLAAHHASPLPDDDRSVLRGPTIQ